MPDRILTYPIRGQKFSYSIEVREHLFSAKTEFQQIDIYDTDCFGKLLTLDGHIQLSDLDEFAYHEALIHVPMLSIPNPRRALVIGGGDGGALRELCRWKCLEHIEMVEIDGEVIEASKKWLPELSDGAFNDPRIKVNIADAFDFLVKVRDPYDFIVMDITDVYEEEEGELSESLMTAKFLSDVRNALSPAGLAVSQADNLVFCPYSLASLSSALEAVFEQTGSYQALVPSFGGFSGFVWAGIQTEVARNWPGSGDLRLKYLNQTTYDLGFSRLPFNL